MIPLAYRAYSRSKERALVCGTKRYARCVAHVYFTIDRFENSFAMEGCSRRLSPYCQSLPEAAKRRYLEKLDLIAHDLDDPYSSTVAEQAQVFPQVDYPDIYNFWVHTASEYTQEGMKAYKSLDGYKYLVAGFVTGVQCYCRGSKFLVLGRVKHSQSLSEPPLHAAMVRRMQKLTEQSVAAIVRAWPA